MNRETGEIGWIRAADALFGHDPLAPSRYWEMVGKNWVWPEELNDSFVEDVLRDWTPIGWL